MIQMYWKKAYYSFEGYWENSSNTAQVNQ